MSDFSLHTQLEADSFLMGDLPLSQLRLNNVKSVPWLILVPRRAQIKDLHELEAADRMQLMEEIAQASRALVDLYAPDKINVAALGNRVPQLHVHVMARFASDGAWPDPVFGRISMDPYEAPAVMTIRTRLTHGNWWKLAQEPKVKA